MTKQGATPQPGHGIALAMYHIPVAAVNPSPTNPRTRFDKGPLDELVASIKQHGILQPVLVRPVDAQYETVGGQRVHKSGTYELVSGHRRHRAATEAGLKEIPAYIKDLSDVDVLELQLVENLQRADLHPLDEADGYRKLLDHHGYNADALALKIGKSRAYVYARLKLAELPEEVKAAFWDNKVNPSVALLIARIPTPSQAEKAAKEIAAFNDGEGMSYRQASAHIQQNYMLTLGDAQFDINNAKLHPFAGTCAACPKRTGNQAELFADITSADVCTDAACYHAKALAHWENLKAATIAAGGQVVEGKAAAELFGWGGGMAWNSPFEKLDETADLEAEEENEKTFRELLGKKHLPPIALAREPKTGHIVELVHKADLKKALAAAGHKEASKNIDVPKPAPAPKTLEQAARDKAREEEENKKSAEERAIQEEALKRAVVIIADETGRATAATLRDVVHLLAADRIETTYGDCDDTALRRGLVKGDKADANAALHKAIKTMPLAQLVGLMIELLLRSHLYSGSEDMKAALAIFKIDIKKITAEVKKERAAAASAAEEVALAMMDMIRPGLDLKS